MIVWVLSGTLTGGRFAANLLCTAPLRYIELLSSRMSTFHTN